MMLNELVSKAAVRYPDATAIKGPDGELSYRDLDSLANRAARALALRGVGPGDRVGIWLPKSARGVAAMQAVMRLGAAYVPVDPTSPVARARTILEDCGVKALVAARDAGNALRTQGLEGVELLAVDDASMPDTESLSADAVERPPTQPDDLAYILYTSGSTGRPKGVCISHANALAFVRWAVDALGARPTDRFANHAPFHFDLSVLDLYAAFAVGATVSLVPEGAAYVAQHLVEFLRSERITFWYSVPSAIVLMMDHGGLLSAPSPSLRRLLFAGEPFPIKHLRALREAWQGPGFWNLYGPTETNVCTAYEVTAVRADERSIPIGRAVSGDRVWARTTDGREAGPGEEGELVVEGPTVFLGYWGKPPQGNGPYATGDIVRLGHDGHFHFLGRRDHMIKLKGHRVELGEVEAALLQHAAITEAAAVIVGEGIAARLVAFIGVGRNKAPTLLDVKRHCAERLPRYMIPDDIRPMTALTRNSNGKVDRRVLAESAIGPASR